MNTVRLIILAFAFIQGGWMTFDGGRALLVGDYVTSRSGPRAGQLGPWSQMVAAVGLEPRGTLVKCLHVIIGLAWLVSFVMLLLGAGPARWMLFGCAIASLWYLPIGIILGGIVIALLLMPGTRAVLP